MFNGPDSFWLVRRATVTKGGGKVFYLFLCEENMSSLMRRNYKRRPAMYQRNYKK